MLEYEFPSGRLVRPDGAADWQWLVNLSLIVTVIAVVVLLAWQFWKSIIRFSRSSTGCGLAVALLVAVAVLLILPAVQQAREAARRTGCKNHLKQISLAIWNYVDAYQQFPFAGKVVADQEQVCSWRMAIWPAFLEAIPVREIYHHEEPWNSEFNLKCLDLFSTWSWWSCPSNDGSKRYTDYSMLTGPSTIGGDGMTVVKPADVTDGTSNTIFIVEACGREILFTEPKDVEVTDESLGVNLPGDQPGRSKGIISSYHVGGGHVVLGDGTVRFISEKIDKSVLKALTTINGGETLPEWE